MLRYCFPLLALAALTACEPVAVSGSEDMAVVPVSPFPEPQPVVMVDEAGNPIEQRGIFTTVAMARATPNTPFSEQLADRTLSGPTEAFLLNSDQTFVGRNGAGADTAGFWEVRETRLCRTFTLPSDRTSCAELTIVGNQVTLDAGGENIHTFTMR